MPYKDTPPDRKQEGKTIVYGALPQSSAFNSIDIQARKEIETATQCRDSRIAPSCLVQRAEDKVSSNAPILALVI